MKLEINNLTTGYGDTKIIENLNLTIPEGKVTALIGANGCGKSTLLKTICRIIRPMDGDVLLDGKSIGDYNSRELAKKVAILPQNPTAPGEITVRELVMYGRAPHQGSLFARTTLHLLLGGDGKSADFSPLARYLNGDNVRLYCFGRDGAQLAALHPEVAEQTETMEQAMRLLATRVQPGDMVLLSPACASLDQFKNFEQRGNEFARLAKELG